MRINLSNQEKLIILFTKGHFSKYENALEVILSDYYAIPVEVVGEVTRLDAIKRLFTKLYNNGLIQTGTLSSSRYLIELFTSSKSPYDAMFAEIQWMNVTDGIKAIYDTADRNIEEKMTLKESA